MKGPSFGCTATASAAVIIDNHRAGSGSVWLLRVKSITHSLTLLLLPSDHLRQFELKRSCCCCCCCHRRIHPLPLASHSLFDFCLSLEYTSLFFLSVLLKLAVLRALSLSVVWRLVLGSDGGLDTHWKVIMSINYTLIFQWIAKRAGHFISLGGRSLTVF